MLACSCSSVQLYPRFEESQIHVTLADSIYGRQVVKVVIYLEEWSYCETFYKDATCAADVGEDDFGGAEEPGADDR